MGNVNPQEDLHLNMFLKNKNIIIFIAQNENGVTIDSKTRLVVLN